MIGRNVKALTTATLVTLACAIVTGCSEPASAPENPAPDLVLHNVDGSGTVSLSEQRGKVVLVDLWATWCVPCIAELPHLQEMADELAPDDFMMLGIVLESGEREEVVEFLAEKEVRYTQVMGEDDTGEAFGPFLGYPTKYLIDRDGGVVKRYFGIIGDELRDEVEQLIETGVLANSDE